MDERVALKVLTADMNLNMALPCCVSVYEQDGRSRHDDKDDHRRGRRAAWCSD
jgi:hypothetical protein